MPSLKEKTGWDHQRKMWERNPRSALWIIPTGRGQRKEKKQKKLSFKGEVSEIAGIQKTVRSLKLEG